MTRPDPYLCAKCGQKTSARKGRVTEQWQGVKGRPCVTVCHDCFMDSCDLFRHDGPLAPRLREIHARGPGRVLVFGGVSIEQMLADCERLDAKMNAKEVVE